MWYKNISNDSDVVISSRVRYARNIKGFKFTHLLDNNELEEIVNKIHNNLNKEKYDLLKMKNIDFVTQSSLREKYLISKEFVGNKNGAIITNEDYSIVAMINEEDHLRIQSFESGFNIDKCYEKLVEFTNELNNSIEFAFDEKYGYLTSCPSNLGSGMRVSVMLHLPGITKSGKLNDILNQINDIGFSIRGIYGENSKSIGAVYQISNRKSLGYTDEEIINNLKIVITSVIELERKARELLKDDIYEIDKVYRAYGILKNSRVINVEEAMKLLSIVRYGVSSQIISNVPLEKIQSLMIEVQNNTLKLLLKNNIDEDEENVKRAEYIRKEMR